MKKTLWALIAVAIVGLGVGTASAEPAAPSAAPAALSQVDGALAVRLGLDSGEGCARMASAEPFDAAREAEAVVCCTAADRAACTADCAPLIGRTFCIHGCECFCF